ncbi:hypothetical protein J7T55_011020 [Diaporthe amygdali]|uniref:uncharacterized protein n=1 Tax=Phomopsis amygdali TaxID=1214568 RepID=UPI0022FE4333|nr:uncharacterized protein J7T55_011020 [Diaporthe amygdali]KAJ0106925.1 hypothetical protein J7T55_011020 [Diaporthe amygdali]
MNLSLSLIFLVAVVSTVSATHLVLPLYVYPTEGAWDYVYKVVRDNPAVTFDVILNVEDGPGSRDPGFNDEWRNATSILKSYNNVQTWGYVHAAYNSSYLGEMAVNISYWARWHLYDKAIALDGIFIDEVPNDQEGNKADDDVYYMTTAVLFAKRIWASYGLKGPNIILNPGTGPVHPEYYDLADFVNVFEDFPWAYDETVLVESFPSQQGHRSSFIMHDVSLTGYNDTTVKDWLLAWTQSVLAILHGCITGSDVFKMRKTILEKYDDK